MISDLNDRHDNQIRNSKLESTLAQVKELTEKKRLVDVEMSELVVRAQRYNKKEQKHVHEMQKIEANNAAKECLAVLQLDITNLKKVKSKNDDWAASQQQIDNIYASRSSGSCVASQSCGLYHTSLGICVTPTDFSSIIHPSNQAESAPMAILNKIKSNYAPNIQHKQQNP